MMTIEDEIIILEDKLIAAVKDGNTTVLVGLLHDDLVFNIPYGLTISNSMDLDNCSSGVMKVYDIGTTDRIVKSIDDFSTVAVTVNFKAKYGDQTIDFKYRYLRVWKLFDNSWKIIASS